MDRWLDGTTNPLLISIIFIAWNFNHWMWHKSDGGLVVALIGNNIYLLLCWGKTLRLPWYDCFLSASYGDGEWEKNSNDESSTCSLSPFSVPSGNSSFIIHNFDSSLTCCWSKHLKGSLSILQSTITKRIVENIKN